MLLLQLNIISGNTPQHIMMADENADREKKDPQPKLVSVTLNFISKKSIHPVENVLKRMMKSFKKQSKPCVINPKYSKPTLLLFRISAFARIKMPGRVCTSKSKVFLKYLFFFHCHKVRNTIFTYPLHKSIFCKQPNVFAYSKIR